MNTDDIGRVLQRWALEPVLSVERATSGSMNETFLITTAQRQVVLRRHRRPHREQVEFEHRVIAHARGNGIPAPAAIPTPQGEVIIDHEVTFYSLFTFARGRQIARSQLTAPHARSMGRMLARLDLALADFPVAAPIADERASDPAPVLATIDNLLSSIEQRPNRTEQDQWAADHLRSKATWLQKATPPVWQQPPVGDLQLIHGDYQESNLFFDDSGSVVDVIDWDKAGVGWPAAEIVRTFDHAFQLHPELCVALIDGYRSLHRLSLDDLDRAAANWNFSRVHDHWVFEGIYLRQDDRLRRFLEQGPFVPFADRWQQLRPALSR